MPALQVWSVCFTVNNYTPELVESIKAFASNCRYLVFGYEVGDNGTPHLQGYAQLLKKMSLAKLGKMFSWHVEPTKGTPEQASAYCKKDGAIEEFGTLQTTATGGAMEQAKWRAISDLAKEGKLKDIDESYPMEFIRSYRTLKELAKDFMTRPVPLDTTAGMWFYGVSGAGKSFTARENYPTFYEKPCNKWWDGYQMEETVLIDDFDKTHACLGHHLKIWADHYPFIAETKGGAMRIRPTRIIVTSQYTIDQIWEDSETREALKRRFRVTHILPRTLNLKPS